MDTSSSRHPVLFSTSNIDEECRGMACVETSIVIKTHSIGKSLRHYA